MDRSTVTFCVFLRMQSAFLKGFTDKQQKPYSMPQGKKLKGENVMFINFIFEDGSNPYVAITHEKLFDMIRKYDLEQLDVDTFLVHGEVHFWTVKKRLSAYDKAKTALREFAIEFQRKASELDYSYGELARWQDFFEFYGKKYGLLREFRENCIC